MEMINETDINFILVYPKRFIKIIKANKNLAVRAIKRSLPINIEYNIIIKGNLVDQNKTFNEIGMQDGEVIVVTKKQSNGLNELDKRIIQITKKDDFEQKMRIFTNKKTKNEVDRLKDIRIYRQEGSLKLQRKIARKMYLKQLKNDDDGQCLNDLKTEYEPLPTPCTDAMPILW